ncbi:response regulator transcription factor [Cohnella thailandensis]|uniref:Response regulator transcription factor n=1 Tax=Cohnella thailandensis TaxID=557557 RepID=A0A841SUC9_9BACL|nr:response regulator transcription factor [Cohnella thailandensis]MBB6633237.1 response regulator transcription factor [Cohnella thailandensis]MBP1975065.1 DNA-binding response OmpR family regulator [Cohnella thailandensis]
MSSRLLLVEDDESLHRGIEFTLRQEGYEVVGARRIAEAEAAVENDRFDLIVLDVQLPDGSGFDFCSKLRRGSDTPVVFLTASDSELDIVRGLDLGGDDYITKPFRLREFLSRIQAVLRRHNRNPARSSNSEGAAVQAGDLALYPQEMRLTKQGREISLSMTEFRLLSLLMNHPRAVLSKEQILQQLWQEGSDYMDDNTIAVNVRRLREKIEDKPNDPQKIITVRGAGYRWNG